MMRYTRWAQHIGHIGWRQTMLESPQALHSLREKIKATGRADSRARWKEVGP
jgi:hypothetical protein